MKPMRWMVVLAGLLVWSAGAQDDPYAKLKAGDFQTRAAYDVILKDVQAAKGDRGKLDPVETKLAAALTGATPGGRYDICRLLWMIGTKLSVPALAPLLADEQTADSARFALERNTSAEAGAALRGALGAAKGKVLIGLINSLGNRRDADAVAPLKALAGGGDAEAAAAATQALGRVGTAPAADALRALPKSALSGQALAQAGAQLLADGQAGKAAEVFASLNGEPFTPATRVAALRGLALSGSDQALPAALAALADKQPYVARGAARLAAVLKDPAAVGKFVDAWPTLAPNLQMVVLLALAERGDAAAAPVALKAIGSADPGLKLAGIRAAALIGGPDAVKPLLTLAAGGDSQQPARDALGRLRGAGVDAALLDLAKTGPAELRSIAFGVLADRADPASVSLMFEVAGGTDNKLASAACAALGRLVKLDAMPKLVDLLATVKAPAVKEAVKNAVIVAARRLGEPDASLAAVLTAYDQATVATQPHLLGILAAVGGDKALAVLNKAAAATNDEVRGAALTGLAEEWEDNRPLPTLLNAAKAEADKELKSTALKGYLRLLGGDDKMKPADKVAALTAAKPLLTTNAERRPFFGALTSARIPAALKLAADCLDDANLVGFACQCVVDLASPLKLGRKELAAVKGPDVKTALAKVVELAKDAKVKAKAKDLAGKL